MKQSARLGLVRHGQTSANIDRVWHGHTDTPLTEIGTLQATRLGEYFHHYMLPDVIYCSPLQRARFTAEAIAEKFSLPVNLDPRLMEFNLGDWEGTTFEALRNSSGNVMEQLVRNPEFAAPGGESQILVKKRMVAAIEEIGQANPGRNVVIVAHGVALAIALSHYLEEDSTQWPKYTKDNTAFSELCLQTRKLVTYNRTDHLAAIS